MTKQETQNIKTTLEVLEDEVRGDVQAAMAKITDDYSMTWVYIGYDDTLFPQTKKPKKQDLEEVYVMKNREYAIRHIMARKNVVMLELVESYKDPKTGKMFRTPEVIVLEFRGKKIARGRHYCDPRTSLMYLNKRQIKKAYHEDKPIKGILIK